MVKKQLAFWASMASLMAVVVGGSWAWDARGRRMRHEEQVSKLPAPTEAEVRASVAQIREKVAVRKEDLKKCGWLFLKGTDARAYSEFLAMASRIEEHEFVRWFVFRPDAEEEGAWVLGVMVDRATGRIVDAKSLEMHN